MATHSSILAWRIPWTEEPGGLQSTGSQRVRHDRGTEHACMQNDELFRLYYICICHLFLSVSSRIWKFLGGRHLMDCSLLCLQCLDCGWYAGRTGSLLNEWIDAQMIGFCVCRISHWILILVSILFSPGPLEEVEAFETFSRLKRWSSVSKVC